MHKSKIKHISLAVCLALMPLSGFAAGLGKLNVSSGLGEPLKAEIELLSVTPEELSTLIAAIASEEAYTAQGITRLGIHNNIQVEVSKATDGSPVLKLRSALPVSDPYLDMLIQVDWASGRLQREYTVLLDPPGYQPQTDAPTASTVSPPTINFPEAGTPNASAVPEDKPAKKSKKAKSEPAVVADAPVSTGADEVTTKKGDTLSAIAKEMQVEGVSLDQMLIGLYENNKEAFSGGNMNRLKVGQIVKLPPVESLTAASTRDASKSVKVHSENWNEYRNNLAGVVAEAPAAEEAEQKQVASGKIGAAEDKAIAGKTGPQDVVKLSAGEKDKVKANSNKEFEAKITALQEETTAREKSLKEAQDRASALEKQIQDMQKLLALKNQTMADAQKNAEAATKPEEKPAESPVAAVVPEVKPEPVAPVEAAPAATEPEKVQEPAVVAEQPAAKPAVVATPAPVASAEAEPGFLDGLLDIADLAIIGGAAGVGLLGAGWMYLRNKRRKDLDSFERGILTSGGLRANTVFGNTTGTSNTSDTSFLTDFAQSADGSMIDTNDVDPIAEAEVYMAYGRDAQAEEILKDAISKEPKRYELHLKLLEMYAARKDTSAFETIAGELYTTLGADDPTWAKVAEMGATMEPGNPLYDVSKTVVAASVATQKLDASDFSTAPVVDDGDLDFSLGSDDTPAQEVDASSAVMQSFSAADTVEQEVSFDLGSIDEGALADEPAQPAEAASFATADNTMDFNLGDFNMDAEPAADSASMKTMDNLPAFDISAASTELGAPTFDMPNIEVADEPAQAEVSDFNMDFDLPTSVASDELEQTTILPVAESEEISFDLDMAADVPEPPTEVASTEISFDLPQVDELVADAPVVEEVANEFDLSSISLDLNEAPAEPELASAAPTEESEDVNIKLDLVAAYIDMDDKEGAKELLEEVLKEGGVQQQMRAQQLLSSLA